MCQLKCLIQFLTKKTTDSCLSWNGMAHTLDLEYFNKS